MSLAQRRTAPEGINVVRPTSEDDILQNGIANGNVETVDDDLERHGSPGDQTTPISPTERKELWQAMSYDAFATPQLQRYESFPVEITDNLAAYDVSTAKRIAQVLFAVLACVLASGIVCGFAALKPILIAEGVYRSLCPADWPAPSGSESQLPCPEQDMRLNFFFITASITLNVSTVLAGYILDKHGRRTCYVLAAGILFAGAALMSLAFHLGESDGRPAAAYGVVDGYVVANLLLGLGGTFLFVSSYQLSNAFPRHAGLVVALVTGAFDASAAVFLFYRLAYEAAPGRPAPAHFFLAFAAAVPPAILAAEFTLMPAGAYSTRAEYQAAIAHAGDAGRDVHDSDDEAYAGRPRELEAARGARAAERGAELEAIEAVAGTAAERRADRETAKGRQATSGVYGILQGRPVGSQMATPWFWLMLVLTVLQMTRMNYFIATVRAQYRYLLGGDEGLAERVNGFFDVALPVAGVVTTPFIGVLLNEVPVWGTLGVLTGLIVVLGVLNCVEGMLWAGYATVVVFVIMRPLYYSAVSDYATKVFGFGTFGRIYGTIICVSGVGQFIQPGLDALTHGPLHNNPIPINFLIAVVSSLISLALTLFVYSETRGKGDGTDEERRSLLPAGVISREGTPATTDNITTYGVS